MATKTHPDSVPLSDNARVVLERRYLAKDERGRVVETPEQLFQRVAHNIAGAEQAYGDAPQVDFWEQRFLDVMTSLRFLPNSPTLGNAGQPLQQLAACFVLPVEDSMEGIFGAICNMAVIHKSGGGTGFSFSRLRPAGDMVRSTAGLASGPVSFMKVFDAATEAIKQGGTRRGANMAILNVEHPDIEDFIRVKSDMVTLTNFNISVGVNERFMEAVERDEEFSLVNPRTRRPVGKRRARAIFRLIVENAWGNGDPGLVFIDRVNRDNPTPRLGPIEATNPCGEQPLLPYESCTLGSINLSRFVREGSREVDWEALAATVPVCVRFLDDVIDQNQYPMPQIAEMTLKTRKIGLGVMGWADLLFELRIPYDSDEALKLGEQMMAFIQEKADAASAELAGERGTFPAWEDSVYAAGRERRPLRNSTRTTVAPTGTLSIIADCSGGIEPAFSLAFTRQHFLDPHHPKTATKLTEVNNHFERVAKEEGFHSKKLIDALAAGASLRDQPKAPDWAKAVFVSAHDVAPEWHVRMQAAFQRHTDNAVSKTINFRQEATQDDVERAYLLAYHEGCKGITIYRDGSREMQVLSHATARGPEQQEAIAAERSMGVAAGPPSLRPGEPYRRRLPDQRPSLTHKFQVGDQEGYLTVGLYDDGSPGEVFVTISKEGSTIRGLMDSVAVLTSLALQYGVPLEDLARKFEGTRFEPYGFTNNPDLRQATSLVDYIFRWLELRFGEGKKAQPASGSSRGRKKGAPLPASGDISTGVACPDCGSVLVFAEGCLVCRSCGYERCA
ncbi:MAG: vitamin B12-dependent ribonucleotide reductase [Dehalococcoidia bacterium]|jgi:ribonucleoside-diphosphate reductase alpha chain